MRRSRGEVRAVHTSLQIKISLKLPKICLRPPLKLSNNHQTPLPFPSENFSWSAHALHQFTFFLAHSFRPVIWYIAIIHTCLKIASINSPWFFSRSQLQIPLEKVISITREKTALVFPNAIGVQTAEEKVTKEA